MENQLQTDTVQQQSDPTFSLEVMAESVNYNEWIYKLMKPYLGARVLELGAGIGNLTPLFLREDRDVVAIDIDENLIQQHRINVQPSERLQVSCISIQDLAAARKNRGAFDSVVSSNVLEHIPDGIEYEVIQSMYDILKNGGYAIHWVPAFQAIFGSLDESFGHYRRYTRAMAIALFHEAGFRVISCEYWNLPGFFGWWYTGRILKKRALPRTSAIAFDRYVVPLLRRIEPWLWRPFGQSLLIVAKKT